MGANAKGGECLKRGKLYNNRNVGTNESGSIDFRTVLILYDASRHIHITV